MNTDLQAIMARRRRLADGGQEKSSAPAPAPAPAPVSHSKEKEPESLQEIMARRRRLADGEEELTVEDLHRIDNRTRQTPSRNSSLQGSGSFEQGAHSSKGDDLQSIMERRRRLADGEETASPSPQPQPPPRNTSFRISPMPSSINQTRSNPSSLNYTPQVLNSPVRRPSGRFSLMESQRVPAVVGGPSAVTPPVKPELKSFSMSSDLKAIMDRRRKLVSGAQESEEDEDPPMERPSERTSESRKEPAGEESRPGGLSEPVQRKPSTANSQRSRISEDMFDRASAHSKEVADPSTHSVREQEPLLDVEDSDESSEDEDEQSNQQIPVKQLSSRNLGPSQHSNRDLESSRHKVGGSSHAEKKNESRRSSLFDDDDDDDSSSGDSDQEFVTNERATPVGTTRTANANAQKKNISLFDAEVDSSSEDERPVVAPLDSPAAAVMGAPTSDTGEEAEEEEENDVNDDDLAEVERFAAALEQDEPGPDDMEEKKDKAIRRSTAQSMALEAADELSELPKQDKALRHKLASRRKIDPSLAQSEEASVDPSVDSRTSNGSGNSSVSGSIGNSARRPRNRRSSSSESSPKKSAPTGNRRRSTATPSSSDKRKQTKSRRASTDERSKSDDEKHSEGTRVKRVPSHQSFGKDSSDDDDIIEYEADTRQTTRGSKEDPSDGESRHERGERSVPASSNTLGGVGWGGFGALDGSVGPESASLPAGSEHSGFPATDFGSSGLGEPFGTASGFVNKVGKGTDRFSGGDAFGGAGDGDGFGGPSGFPGLSGEGFPASGDGFSGAFMADFGDSTAFPSVSKNEEKVDFSNNAFESGGFKEAFGNFDGGNAFGASGPDAFEQVNFVAPPVKESIVYETSPLSGVPMRPQPGPAVFQKTVMKGPFRSCFATNCLNGNMIVCTDSGNGMLLREVDPSRYYIQVFATPVVSNELKKKVTARFNLTPHSVESVVKLSAGLHSEQGQTRIRVAAILDLRVLESSQPLRLVVVWQWGQGGVQPICVLYTLSPPSGSDFTYDEGTLVTADNLIFLAGTSPKGPCVFVSKPAVRESWTANSLPGSGKVTIMELTPNIERDQPYLAIGLTDRSISIWTYREAVDGLSNKNKESGPKRWLFPLCRLESSKTLSGIDATSLNPTGTSTGQDSKNTGHCTHFAWLPKRHPLSSLTLLAAFFQNGLAIYHIALPAIHDKTGPKPIPEATSSTTMSQTPRLWPMVAKRWQGKHEQSLGSWVDLGPLANPCLSVLLHASDWTSARIIFGIVNLPSHRRGLMPKEKLLPFRVLATKIIPKSSGSFPSAVLLRHDLGCFLCNSEDRLFSVSLATDAANGSERSLFFPVASQPTGVSSLGEIYLSESVSDKDGILHIFSVEHCERNKLEGDMIEWSRPSRRFWLCRTVTGDNKECVPEESKEEKAASGFGDAEVELGGALSDTICEIYDDKLIGLIPVRLTRCQGADICAVLYRPSLCSKTGYKDGTAMDAVAIAVVDYSTSTHTVEVLEGRDISFWSLDANGIPRGSILTKGGLSVVYFSWDAEIGACEFGASYRPLLGVEDDKDYVECRRVYCYCGAGKVGVVAVGTKLRDNRTCIVAGDLCSENELTAEKWSRLLPNIVTGRVCWLRPSEEVFAIVGLEGDDSGYRNFSLSTSERVIILSSAMEISADTRASLASPALAPLGAFAVGFLSGGKFKYLCCLDGALVSDTIATLAHGAHGSDHSCLLAARPDRIVVAKWHHSVRLVENGHWVDSFILPAASTRPVFLLEPMVANAVCIGGKQNQSTQVLRAVIEKFGRKVASLTHGDDEGIGNLGTGISPKTYAILQNYGLREAACWLLTGAVKFDRAANTRILPPWAPVSAKLGGAPNSDAFLHVVSNGDQYFSDYVKAPDSGAVASLPRRSDPSSYLSLEKAEQYIMAGKAIDAIKMLDLGGSEQSESLMVQLALLLEKDTSKDLVGIIQNISGIGKGGLSRSDAPVKLPSSLAALSLSLKQTRNRGQEPGMAPDNIIRWMVPMAPSLQRGARMGRLRGSILGEEVLQKAGDVKDNFADPIWTVPCNESKHVWNEGPKKEKDKLLLLDRVDDWLGRRRPALVGKEGASAARDRGEKTLADLMNMDDNSFGGKSDLESEKDGWVDGVGEGRTDEANLSGYFRMSEGEEDDNPWRSEGFMDISPYQNKAFVYGDTERFILEKSTSSVDEGESGKVKALYDLVFESASIGGLVLAATRGGSLDIGVLHTDERQSRQKCTLEFWYHIPENIKSDLVLARRTYGPDAGDLSKVSVASERDSVLWEVVLQPKGFLEFRTCGGSKLSSKSKDTQEGEKTDVVQFGKWNHVCIIFSSKSIESITDCSVTIIMKGVTVAESTVSMLPSGFDEEDLESSSTLNDLLQKSHLLFGLNNPPGFRMTELRAWACTRSEDDTKAMLYEYLNAAESKKKFKVKIKNKNKGGGLTLGKGGMVSGPQRGVAGAQSGLGTKMTLLSLAPKVSLAPQPMKEDRPQTDGNAAPQATAGFGVSFDVFGNQTENISDDKVEQDMDEVPASLWDTAVPLSHQVRSSAAAALIRGPPATRHFGGNRGGLPDFSGMERYGVGGIAICGSEKTIVFRDNEDPPALTYPIGASGAVVSDQMDDEGSEFLCCFLARDRRMVVFELQSRTVVVELQMTTKLNFWRFLPPEAGENTLCFMLVTPVGGFHWMPLDESPRPHQVWKRGSDLQGKKVVSYEEGGSNGMDGPDILSTVGLIMVTKASAGGALEAWIIPIDGDSNAKIVNENVMGACLCLPPDIDDGPFLPLIVAVLQVDDGVFVNVMSLYEEKQGSVDLGEVAVTIDIDMAGFEDIEYEAPVLAMGTYPAAICCSLANIVVVIIRSKGLVVAYELEDGDMSLIAREGVGHYVIDAVMRYSEEVGGAEIVMLLSDTDNPKDGRMVSFCFRSAA